MQRLLRLFVALALLTMPMAMVSGAAAAHPGAPATMRAGCHDGGAEPTSPRETAPKGVGMSAECALACAALPALPARLELPALPGPTVYALPILHGLATAGPESLDPPPRG